MKLRPPVVLALCLAGSALVTFLYWRGVWFGRRLDDAELAAALAPDAPPRATCHGIVELTKRWTEGQPGMDRWAERLVEVSRRDDVSVRRAAAWAMQWDAEDEAVAARLREIVTSDASISVRRNAACSLSRAKDPSAAVPVLRSMLEPFPLQAPVAGTVESLSNVGRAPREDEIVGKLRDASGAVADVLAPVPGRVTERRVEAGAPVARGDVLVVLAPDAEHVLAAAAALGYAGTAADAELLRTLLAPGTSVPPDVARQVQAAIAEIKSRQRR